MAVSFPDPGVVVPNVHISVDVLLIVDSLEDLDAVVSNVHMLLDVSSFDLAHVATQMYFV